jgi:hypothetical protein
MRAVILVFLIWAAPAMADEIVLWGTPFIQHSDIVAREVTTLTDWQQTSDGAKGTIDTSEWQTSFTADFEVTCEDAVVRFVDAARYDGKQLPIQHGVAIRSFQEFSLITFGDGQEARVDITGDELPTKVKEIGFAAFSSVKERDYGNSSPEVLAEVLTGQIIAYHPQLLPFLARLLLARACAPAP